MGEKIIPIPPSISEERGLRGPMLVRSWRRSSKEWIGLAIFGVFWWGFIGLMFLGGWQDGDWIPLLFSLPFLAAGCWLIYRSLALFLNRTEFEVVGDVLEIRNVPMPWPGRATVRRDEIVRLFVSENQETDSYGRSSSRFELHMVDREHRQRPLVRNFHNAHEALFVEHRLEALMGIDDGPVIGAYSGESG